MISREIAELEDEELAESAKLESERLFNEHLKILHKAYVEYLDEDYLFKEMYISDKGIIKRNKKVNYFKG